ncbi:MAG: hypothetical protein J5608_01565 [Alphaproteobacteria bacterium]|nr:hypothetical protein [Alphaproteobacteria bacterium]
MCKQLTIFDPVIEEAKQRINVAEQDIKKKECEKASYDNNIAEDRNEIIALNREIDYLEQDIQDAKNKMAECQSYLVRGANIK